MESTTAPPTPAVPEKIAPVPPEPAASIVHDTETFARDSAQELVEAARVVVAAGIAAVHDIEKVSEDLAHRVLDAPATPPAPVTPPVPPVPLAATVADPV